MKFSIITITYNRANLIGETIQSVLNQTYSNFEHIIIDDGSTDNTEEAVKNYNDKRIHYYNVQKIGRLSTLRNIGIKKSKGQFISFLDSDDLLHPSKLKKTFQIFKENLDVNICIHNISFFTKEGISKVKVYDYNKDFRKNILQDLLNNKFKSYASFTFRRTVLKKIGVIDQNLSDGHHDFLARIVSEFEVYFLHESLIKLRKHASNMSFKENDDPLKEYLITLQKLLNNKVLTTKYYEERKGYIYSEMARMNVNNYQFKTYLNKSNSYIKLNQNGIKLILKNIKLLLFRKSHISS